MYVYNFHDFWLPWSRYTTVNAETISIRFNFPRLMLMFYIVGEEIHDNDSIADLAAGEADAPIY